MIKKTLEILKEQLNENTTKTENGCWLYNGNLSPAGYGRLWYEGKTYFVHRLSAYIHWNFDVFSPMQINHKIECVNKNCWNPDHLYIGTQFENYRDAAITRKAFDIGMDNRNRELCPKGHEYTEENTYISKTTGGRRCRTCIKEYNDTRPQRSKYWKENS